MEILRLLGAGVVILRTKRECHAGSTARAETTAPAYVFFFSDPI